MNFSHMIVVPAQSNGSFSNSTTDFLPKLPLAKFKYQLVYINLSNKGRFATCLTACRQLKTCI